MWRRTTVIFEEIESYINRYNNLATKEVLFIELENRTDLTDEEYSKVKSIVENLTDEDSDLQWLYDTSEKWCQERAIYLALMESIQIADGQDRDRDAGAIPHILSEALGVSFDAHIGHDYISDSEERYESYHQVELRSHLIWSFSTKLRKAVYQTKRLTLPLLELAWANHCLCVTWALRAFFKGRTYCTSHWRWQRRRSWSALMRIFST